MVSSSPSLDMNIFRCSSSFSTAVSVCSCFIRVASSCSTLASYSCRVEEEIKDWWHVWSEQRIHTHLLFLTQLLKFLQPFILILEEWKSNAFSCVTVQSTGGCLTNSSLTSLCFCSNSSSVSKSCITQTKDKITRDYTGICSSVMHTTRIHNTRLTCF